jgi:hypothetical protein
MVKGMSQRLAKTACSTWFTSDDSHRAAAAAAARCDK